MQFAVVILVCVAVAGAQYNSGSYTPYSTPRSVYSPFVTTPPPYKYAPVVSTAAPVYNVQVSRVVADARNAQIVKLSNEINPDGSYSYFYETDNGIAAQEQGVPRDLGGNPPVRPVVAQGSFSYTSPEGVPVSLRYIADENGFQPESSALPTPPPLPPQIARALAYIGNLKK
ncbi:hypothetical protein K1T71_004496 [Dendrolimus kikuchii]|uniref:Uncharacterized protein n=1 Tax=Dendrolimus kikuchii TaxID=765133 RepID=A0ACC1D7U4_9NEOP|nr:hypothetical protein K1T71_004496 [Dendrolimus kikuchii]